MALPRINQPLHTFNIPSKNIEATFRPFLVSEEKILLMAQASGNPKEIIKSIQQVINNCSTDQLDVLDLTTFDVEYLFLKLRGVSVNNVVKITATDPEDGESYPIEIDINDIEIVHDPDHTNHIKVDDNISIKMKYPAVDMMDAVEKSGSEVGVFFDLMAYSIDKVFAGDEVINFADESEQERMQFIEQLDVNTFTNISNFFKTMPKLKHETTYTNKSGKEQKIVLETLSDFFSLG